LITKTDKHQQRVLASQEAERTHPVILSEAKDLPATHRGSIVQTLRFAQGDRAKARQAVGESGRFWSAKFITAAGGSLS